MILSLYAERGWASRHYPALGYFFLYFFYEMPDALWASQPVPNALGRDLATKRQELRPKSRVDYVATWFTAQNKAGAFRLSVNDGCRGKAVMWYWILFIAPSR
jgi:hypothetical protein